MQEYFHTKCVLRYASKGFGFVSQVDRLVVAGMDEQHQQQQELQPEQPQQQMGHPAGSMDAQQMGNQQSKLPDINQPRTQSR